MFQAIVANENLESRDVEMTLALNFKLTYNGSKISRDPVSQKTCQDVVYCQPPQNNPVSERQHNPVREHKMTQSENIKIQCLSQLVYMRRS